MDSYGVPVKTDDTKLDSSLSSPDARLAFKVALNYYKMFDFLDNDVDAQLTQKDIVRAYKQYGWPLSDDMTTEEVVAELFSEFDFDKNGTLNLVEFSRMMESLWLFEQYVQKRKCMASIDKALGVFGKLFDWLD